jgi:hypothetical protein
VGRILNVLGVRCSNTDFAYAVLSGRRNKPVLMDYRLITYPRGYAEPERLRWLLQELDSLNLKHKVDRWAVKRAEMIASKGKAYHERVACEAIVSLSAAKLGNSAVVKKVKVTIAKDLGLSGKASSLTNALDYNAVPGLANQPDKIFEAIVVAWSELD